MKINNRKRLNVVLLVFYIALIFLINNLIYTENSELVIGKEATENVISKETFENKAVTEQKRLQAENSVPSVYRIQPNVQIEVSNKIDKLGETVLDVKYNSEMTNEDKLKYLKSSSTIGLKDESLKLLLNSNLSTIREVMSISKDLLQGAYSRGIKEAELDKESEILINSLEELDVTENQKKIIADIIDTYITPNEVVDEKSTNELKEEARNSVSPVMVQEGDIVILKGEEITQEKADLILKSGNTIGENANYLQKFGPYFILFSINFVWIFYIYNNFQHVYLSNRFIILMISNLTVFLVSEFLGNFNIILIPSLLCILITIAFVDKKMVLANTFYIAAILGFMMNLPPSAIIYLTLEGLVLSMFKSDLINPRLNFMRVLFSAIISVLVYNFMNIVDLEIADFFVNLLFGFLGAVFYSALAIGSSYIWGNFFDILTRDRLIALQDANNPLLVELSEKAPGTYQHSIAVSNIAEYAAKEINADYLMTKVGALYHDIGKLENPDYFSENQFNIENPHDRLLPEESASIIISHVEKGKAIAKSHGIHGEIIKFIDEHHGDTFTNYFLYKAKSKNEFVDVKKFQYNGKKPQSKETAIVMLADSCEAAARSINKKTEKNIYDMIDKVIDGKISENQLTECDLTFKELEMIRKSFKKTIRSINHERIEYPGEEDD